MKYEEHLAQATEFTISLGADVPEFKRATGTLLTPETGLHS